ncbi:MAG TPA: hypothetical protein VNG71_01200 [Pyrinomonadaceae bacterium]|nr:hypothetical protein [Pyrinomonadaceae bacterium]
MSGSIGCGDEREGGRVCGEWGRDLSIRLRGTTDLAIIDVIKEKVRDGDYEFAIPHFFEERSMMI